MKFSRTIIFTMVFVLFLQVFNASALTLYSGGNTFNVRVHNSSYKTINDARGTVSAFGSNARIRVSAPGYRDGDTTVYLNPDKNYYTAQVRLQDPNVNVDVIDSNLNDISGSSFSWYSQSLYWGDEFGIRGYLPKQGFENLTYSQIEVRVNHMFAWGERIYLRDSGDRWSLEVIIKRKDLDRLFNNIRITIQKDSTRTPAIKVAFADIERLVADYNRSLKLAAEKMNEIDYIFLKNRLEVISRQILKEVVSLSLEKKREINKQVDTNSSLYREVSSMIRFSELNH